MSSENWEERALKAEAQLEAEQKRRAAVAESLQAHQDKLDELMAQLAKQAPLIEAAMTIDELDIQMGLALGMPAAVGATAFAALKLRSEK
jgi:hypothetical protein